MENNNKYLIRIEGVNLGNVLDDTRQLSVQRGSGLLLLQAIKDIEGEFKALELKKISSGASVGLFSCTTKNAMTLRDKIADYLNEDPHYRHLTFVVDIIKNDNANFQTNIEKAMALNRFRQFQQPILTMPPLNEKTDTEPCAWDNLRPGVSLLEKEGKTIAEGVKRSDGAGKGKLAASAYIRHNYGRKQKRDFVNRETGCNFDYTHDLHEIAKSENFGNLSDKIAILYFDGNKFGKLQSKCKTPEQLNSFDITVQDKRRAFLKELVTQANNDSNFKTIENAIRLEILLWGGDEFMLVVPAWKGMEVLQLFYRESKDWKVEIGSNEYQLTHAGGLVYCHVKTPIVRIRKLAKEMADHIKYKHIKVKGISPYNAKANLYEYLVLESIDFPTQSYGEFLSTSYGVDIHKNWIPQRPLNEEWPKTTEAWKEIKEAIPHRQAYRLAAASQTSEAFSAAYERFETVMDGAEKKIEKSLQHLFPAFISNATDNQKSALRWLHLIELWDYFAPKAGDEQ